MYKIRLVPRLMPRLVSLDLDLIVSAQDHSYKNSNPRLLHYESPLITSRDQGFHSDLLNSLCTEIHPTKTEFEMKNNN